MFVKIIIILDEGDLVEIFCDCVFICFGEVVVDVVNYLIVLFIDYV